MGIKLRKTSDVFLWINSIKNHGIDEFYYKDLPEELKENKVLFYRATISELLIPIGNSSKGTTKWKLNLVEINRIDKED